MVDKLRSILTTIEKEKGPVTLFAILKMDDLVDRWTVILSAAWVKNVGSEIFQYLVQQLINNLGDDIKHIARVGVYSLDEHLVEDLLKYKKGSHITEPVQANGNLIHEAYILESKNAHSSAPK